MSENRIHVSLTIMMWAGTSTGWSLELVSLNVMWYNASFTADFKITVHGGCPHPPNRWSKMIVTCPPQGSPTALSSRGRPPRPSSSWSACSLRTGRPSEGATQCGSFQYQDIYFQSTQIGRIGKMCTKSSFAFGKADTGLQSRPQITKLTFENSTNFQTLSKKV